MLPDLDVLGFAVGVSYGDFLGHRGFSHSLVFAALLSFVVVQTAFRSNLYATLRTRLYLVFFLVTASHGILDGLTNGGLGIAYFAPFDNTRYFLPWQPVQVSPIGGLEKFLQSGGLAVLTSEFKWIILPGLVFLCSGLIYQRVRVRSEKLAENLQYDE